MSAAVDVVEPDEVYERHGETIGLFGQAPCVPYGQPIDPIPTVYASDRGIEVVDYPYSLDEAERFAARILNAVRWQRAQATQSASAGTREQVSTP